MLCLRLGTQKLSEFITKMGRGSWSERADLKKGAWSPEEDQKLIGYVERYGVWNWSRMPKPAGLSRSGKSCRLRWVNYLRPNIKHGNFSKEEEETIFTLHEKMGNRWSAIAARLPGRTDNEIKNHWHSHLKKCLKERAVLRTASKEIEITSCDTDTKLKKSMNTNSAMEASNSDGTLNSTLLLPSSSINADHSYSSVSSSEYPIAKVNRINTNGSSEAIGEISSFWTQPFPTENLYTEDLQAMDVYPECTIPTCQLWYQEPLSPYCSCNDAHSDLWFI